MRRSEPTPRFKLRLSFLATLFVVVILLLLTNDPRQATEGAFADPIFDRDIVAYSIEGEGAQATVKYQYVGAPLPEKLHPLEEPALRTETSFTKRVGTTTDGLPLYELIAFTTDKAFVKKNNAWYQRESGQASLNAFSANRVRNPIASLLWQEVHADSISPYSSAGDGLVAYGFSESGLCGVGKWNTMHDATDGTTFGYTTTGTTAGTSIAYDSDLIWCDGAMYRAFTPFDTSAIPSGSTISAATLNLYFYSIDNSDNDGDDWVTVVQASSASHTTLSTADYDTAGAINTPTEGIDSGERKDLTSISTAAYTVITLNATGRGWVNVSGGTSQCSATTGITCLAIREGHDVLDSQITTDTSSYAYFYASENTGTANDPYLSVTYSPPSSAPTVTTSAATSVTASTATANGDVTATGGSAATTCGFAWGTVSTLRGGDTATTTDSTCPGSTGAFTKNLTSLSSGTTYYFKAYATNGTGTGYGTIQSFSTLSPSQIATNAATAVSPSGGVLNATITGGETATTCGFAWGTVSTLRGGDTATTTDSGCPSIGTFSRVLTGLNALTTYYFRAYGTGASTGYGTILSFTTDTTTPARVMRLFGNIRLGGVRLLGI